ncbi:MAG: OmpP1/FadL family transporter [Nitrospiraceae bacterium]
MSVNPLRLVRWITIHAACVMLAVLVGVSTGQAQTPRIQGQGAAASGMGNAFAAQADDASALHYNPAGMTQLRGVEVMAGALFIGGTTNFTSSSTGVNTTGDRAGSVAWPPPTHLYITANMKDIGIAALEKWTAGVGVNVPFGSLTKYPDNNPFSNTIIYNTLPLLDIKPTVAYKLNDYLSFGLGADIYTFSTLFGDGQLEVRNCAAPGCVPPPLGSTHFEVNGSGTGAGFNTSLMYTPFRNADGKPLANIGLIYRSQAVVPLSGQLLVNGTAVADAKANLVLPPIYAGGISLWPVRDQEREWKLEMDVDYVGWKTFRTTTISLSTGGGIPVPQNWRNAYTVMLGTEYKWLKIERLPEWEIAARAGYMNIQSQMPDQTFNPGIPSADQHIPSFGLGFTCKENGSFLGLTKCGNLGIGAAKPKSVGLDLAYQALFYETRTISGNTTNSAIDGTYKTLIHAASVTLRFNF